MSDTNEIAVLERLQSRPADPPAASAAASTASGQFLADALERRQRVLKLLS